MSRQIVIRSFRRVFFSGAIALVACASAGAATRVWPVLIGPGCNGTLQQCIDGAPAGDTVRIVNDDLLVADGYTAVDEDVVIGKALTLEASPGVDAVFAPGRSILVESPTTGAHPVVLRRLVLRAGNIRVFHRSGGAATYTLDQVRIVESIGGLGECAIDLNDRGLGAPSFVVGDSSLRFSTVVAAAPSAICANGDGGAWQLSIFRNYIESDRGALYAGISIAGTSSGAVSVNANQLYAFGAIRGIVVSQNPGSSANALSIRDNLITGQAAPLPSSEAALRINPTNTDLRIVNNTIARNRGGVRIAFTGADASAGVIANNIIAFQEGTGLDIDSRHAAIANRHNLVFANGSNNFTPGIGTSGLDPGFTSRYDFRPLGSSGVRNSGNNADVASVLGVAFDADGERRIAQGTVDLGAFEWTGDASTRHVASSDNTFGNSTRLVGRDYFTPGEKVILTPLRGPVTGPELDATLGVFQDTGSATFYAFHENVGVAMSPGRRIHTLVAGGGARGFLHQSTLASIVDAYSRISHPDLDANPGAIAFVTHNWNPNGEGGIYHDHRLGLDYAAPNWFVGNQDDVTMQSGRAFNIVVAPVGSPNAFVRDVGATARRELRLEHRLLDDNPCATLQVGRVGTVFNDTAFALEYRAGFGGAPGHWFIVAEGAGTPMFPASTAFNVMVSGAQANACRVSGLFTDGFE